MHIGERLRVVRAAAGLTQRDIAIAIGRTQGHVTRIEIGERQPSYQDVAGWLSAAGVDPQKFEDAQLWHKAEQVRSRYRAAMDRLMGRLLTHPLAAHDSGNGPAHESAPRPTHAGGDDPLPPPDSESRASWHRPALAGGR